MSLRLAWWRIQIKDFIELFVLPGLAAVLPWSLCFRLFKWVAKCPWLYRHAVASGYVWAAQYVPGLSERQWGWERRLLTLVDHADLVLSCTRSSRWFERHVQVQGRWPESDRSNVICTFHWGAGMWSLPAMRQAGLNVHALAASLDSAQFVGRPVLHLYARWRTAKVVQLLGHPTIDVTSSMRPLLKAIKDHDSLLGVVDVPADNFGASISVKLQGQAIRVPRGLLRLASDRQLPVTVFLAGLDFETGRRQMRVHQLGTVSESQKLFDNVFQFLDCAIDSTPGAWHLWAEMPRFTEKNSY